MSESTTSAAAIDLSTLLDPRAEHGKTRRAVVRAIRAAREQRENYRGGLPAERQAYATLKQSLRSRIRAAYLGRRGRRIDLISLLRQRTEDRQPVWALVDPTQPISVANGQYDDRGYVRIAPARGATVTSYDRSLQNPIAIPLPGKPVGKDFRPIGLPAIPPRARQIVTSPAVRKRAAWVGVLYQPEHWQELVDPAIVVEWRDRPGEYYALAVWGADRAAIMEWVD